MKLSETLKSADRTVKIGTDHGSGFLYIGSPRAAIRTLNKTEPVTDGIRWADREVIRSYDSDPVIDEALIIIVDGNENGRFWFAGEKDVPERASKPRRRKTTEEPVPYKNHEGYDDPTVFFALRNIVRSQRREVFA